MKNILTSLLLVVILLISVSQSVYTQESIEGQSFPVKEFTINNCVSQFNFNDTVQTSVGYQFWFVDSTFIDGRTLKMSVVAPDSATHPPHIHKEDEFFFILEGKAEFHLDGKTMIAEAYASFYCPANVKHGIKNIGETELKYLVIKKYED